VFEALLGAELTNRQGVIFRYLARLMMVVPGATIHTLIEFMEEPDKIHAYLPQLDPTTQRFFSTQFFSSRFDATRSQITDRLWGIMATGTLERIFSHPKNKCNLFEAMNKGSLILINTAKDYLKREQCEIFGRFMIALISQATQERAALPPYARRPTFIYLDEAQDYFGDEGVGIGELLNQGRKYRVGLTLAFQNLGQLDRKLQASLMASTALKYVGGVSAGDAADLAKEMHCEKEFIQNAKKSRDETQFAVYIKNVTPEAVGLIVPFGELERMPKMMESEYRELIALNHKRISGAAEERKALPKVNLTASQVDFDLEEPPKM